MAVIGSIDTEVSGLFLPEGADEEVSIISTTGRGYFLLMIAGARDEPTVHVLNEMPGSAAESINSWERPFLILCRTEEALKALAKEKLEALNNITYGIDTDDTIMQMILQSVNSDQRTLPIFIIADSFGRVVYFSQGYNTSLGDQISEVIAKIK